MSDTKKYDSKRAEKTWGDYWEQQKVYQYSPLEPRENTYVVDTPPPTVSGALHIGHVFSYTQTDALVRYKRMRGFNIFYPMGWDDNGLPTERRIQKLFNVLCDPTLSYDETLLPKQMKKSETRRPLSRRNFIELCNFQTAEDEKKYESLWRRLGLSVDWSQSYATMDERARATSQKSFLDLARRGLASNRLQPTYWDTDFQTAIAQAEIEERTEESQLHTVRFEMSDNSESFFIATTRPELLAASIAIVAHPSDTRYQRFFGRNARTPLFGIEVSFLASEHAIPEKGTGALMVCTFGDADDLHFWKNSELPLRQILSPQGRLQKIDFRAELFQSRSPETAERFYEPLQGLSVLKAREQILKLLSSEGLLCEGSQKFTHAVKYYEKGDKPLELMPVRQWFIHLLDHKEDLLQQGAKICWHPPHMKHRYDQWVQGLNQDWSLSRQRHFGVPLPVWYPLDDNGRVMYEAPLFPVDSQLPIDPARSTPPGYLESQRGLAGGFIADPDVMDTWGTSSVSPFINSHWHKDPERHRELFPADLRPQGHEIIRTWAFYTIAKAWFHEQDIPWKDIALSGWVVDPSRNKMSKSKGNIVEPEKLLETYSADAIRYWALRARLGVDTLFDENSFKMGRKLETKLMNAARFVRSMELLTDVAAIKTAELQPTDKSWLASLCNTVQDATTAFESLDYASALECTERSFWDFCDDYIELVKVRAYQGTELDALSARLTLHLSLKIFLRLFAPFMPFVTEELWQAGSEVQRSIHKSEWPDRSEFPSASGDDGAFIEKLQNWKHLQFLIGEIRKAKSAENMGAGHTLKRLQISADEKSLEVFKMFAQDLEAACRVLHSGLEWTPSSQLGAEVQITLEAEPGKRR